MTYDYELADDNRADLIYESDRCRPRCCLRCSISRWPHPRTPGATDK